MLTHADGALLVTGMQGTGKTAVLRERFATLIEGGADPERVPGRRIARARDDAATAPARPAAGLAAGPPRRDDPRAGQPGAQGAARGPRLGEPPAVLSAAEQFAKVRELLAAQDPADWPAYGRSCGMRGFADEVRQFLLRAQEALRTPDEHRRGRRRARPHGLAELARFLGEYQAVLDDLNAVDFAGAPPAGSRRSRAEGTASFDHLLVDDYQDTTLAGEAHPRRAAGARLWSSPATPRRTSSRSRGPRRCRCDGSRVVPRRGDGGARHHRTARRGPPSMEAWVAPHTSEEHAAIARELRRLHVEDGVAGPTWRWSCGARAHTWAGCSARWTTRGIPGAVPERGLSLTAEPATLPYVLALRWLVADRGPPRGARGAAAHLRRRRPIAGVRRAA